MSAITKLILTIYSKQKTKLILIASRITFWRCLSTKSNHLNFWLWQNLIILQIFKLQFKHTTALKTSGSCDFPTMISLINMVTRLCRHCHWTNGKIPCKWDHPPWLTNTNPKYSSLTTTNMISLFPNFHCPVQWVTLKLSQHEPTNSA